MNDYKDASLQHKPFIYSINNPFSIVLPDLTFEAGVDMDEDALKLLKPIEKQGKYDLKI